MEMEILDDSFHLDEKKSQYSLMDMVRNIDSESGDDDEIINLTGDRQEMLKAALNDYINERLHVISEGRNPV